MSKTRKDRYQRKDDRKFVDGGLKSGKSSPNRLEKRVINILRQNDNVETLEGLLESQGYK
jgi:hypothetical protein